MSISPAAAGLIARLDALAPLVAAHAAQAEHDARLPQILARPLLEAGFFRMWIPAAYGGLELTLRDALAVYEHAGQLEGSIGWAVMIGNGGGLFGAWLPPQGAQELFGPAAALVAGSGAPNGTAERVAGGYQAQGQWRYASGAHQASVFTANCRITEGGRPVADASGQPLVRAMSFKPADVSLQPDWDVSGLKGTGSHSFRVASAFVPEHHTFSVITDPPREQGPLYRLPFMVLTQLPVAAVGLGIARHALVLFSQLVRSKPGAAGQPLANDATVQARVAEAAAELTLVQAGLDTVAAQAWDTVSDGRVPDARQLAEIAAVTTLGLVRLRAALEQLAALAGMDGIGPAEFARACRDFVALCAHGSVSPRNLAAAGATLLA